MPVKPAHFGQNVADRVQFDRSGLDRRQGNLMFDQIGQLLESILCAVFYILPPTQQQTSILATLQIRLLQNGDQARRWGWLSCLTLALTMPANPFGSGQCSARSGSSTPTSFRYTPH